MNWIPTKTGSYYFKRFEFFENINPIFKDLPLKSMLFANAKFGGPFALTLNPNVLLVEIKKDDPKHILIFNNKGILMHKIQRKESLQIAVFDFLENETLFVLFRDGTYWLIDPHTGRVKVLNLGSRFITDYIYEGKVAANGCVFYTGTKSGFHFHFISDILHASASDFKHVSFKNKPADFLPIPPKTSLSEKWECLVTHEQAGLYRLVQDQQKEDIIYNSQFKNPNNVLLSSLPEIKSIVKMALSPSENNDTKFFAFLCKNNVLYIQSADFSNKIDMRYNVEAEKEWTGLSWCSEDAVVLSRGRNLKMFVQQHEANYKIPEKSKGVLLSQEIDGLKIVSSKSIGILRLIPQFYYDVLHPVSLAPGSALYKTYEEYERREPTCEDNLVNNKEALREAVESCINSACFETDVEEQLKLLRAAAFGKDFLHTANSKFDHDSFAEACKYLRVANALKNETFARAITYRQLRFMSEEHLVDILVKYQKFYLADEVCKYLSLSQRLIPRIYIKWACAKIESNEPEEVLSTVIYKKLKQTKNISYTEIAARAHEISKTNLALNLLRCETSLAKKVPVLIWMDKFELALSEAIRSRDPNLIYLVILRLMKTNLDDTSIFNMLSKNPVSKPFLISCLKNFYPEKLDAYQITHLSAEQRGLYAISKAYETQKMRKRVDLLKYAVEFFSGKDAKDKWYEKVTKEQYEFLSSHKEEDISSEKPINTVLEELFKAGDLEGAEKLRKKYDIPLRRYNLTRLRMVAEKREWDEFERLVAEQSKSKWAIPYFAIVDLMTEHRQNERVIKYVHRLPDVDDQIKIFNLIGAPKAAAEAAKQNKRYNVLESMTENANLDPMLREDIIAFLNSVRRR